MAGLVEFQRLTGCRPGEACAVRRCDIDDAGPVWLYQPPHHKNAHRGQTRTVAIGAKAQAVLRGFFTPDPTDYLFSPGGAVAELRAARAARAAERKMPRYPSHVKWNAAKRVKHPRRTPAAKCNTQTYGLAVGRACDRAFPPPGKLAQRPGETKAAWAAQLTADQREQVRAWRKAHRWHPYQLRHAFTTRVRSQHELEAVQVLLGHARAGVTQVYPERNDQLAAKVVGRIG